MLSAEMSSRDGLAKMYLRFGSWNCRHQVGLLLPYSGCHADKASGNIAFRHVSGEHRIRGLNAMGILGRRLSHDGAMGLVTHLGT